MTSILFIGNSFTARNNVPQLLVDLATERGHSVRFDLIQAGGASLRMHWNKGDAANAIATGKYDWVVLQEQSTLPEKNANRTRENIELFVDPIAATGAKLALYLTWARRNAPESQPLITNAYTSIGNQFGATVVPAGVAWEAFLANHTTPLLHDKDLSHPTLAGSYLAACVFLATLFKEDATGITTDLKGITAGERLALQRVAWDVAKKYGSTIVPAPLSAPRAPKPEKAQARARTTPMKSKLSKDLRNGDHCNVVGGTHAGKSGTVADMNTSKTGHVTITVVQANGVRFKTLTKNVVAQSDATS